MKKPSTIILFLLLPFFVTSCGKDNKPNPNSQSLRVNQYNALITKFNSNSKKYSAIEDEVRSFKKPNNPGDQKKPRDAKKLTTELINKIKTMISLLDDSKAIVEEVNKNYTDINITSVQNLEVFDIFSMNYPKKKNELNESIKILEDLLKNL